MEDLAKESIDIYCPKCNVQVQAPVVAEHVQAIPIEPPIQGDLADTPHEVRVFRMAECQRCGEVFLTRKDYYEIPGEVSAPQTDLITLYPKPRGFDESLLPGTIARPYKSAAGSHQVGLYEPCVIMCRKCLEAICHEHGIVKGNLKERLDGLLNMGVIDHKLFNWATALRLVGNDAAHEMELVVTREDATDSLEFIEALFSYLFFLDRRFQEFRARRGTTEKMRPA